VSNTDVVALSVSQAAAGCCRPNNSALADLTKLSNRMVVLTVSSGRWQVESTPYACIFDKVTYLLDGSGVVTDVWMVVPASPPLRLTILP